jgi:tetratricopeptide (TPR) repeat protein
MTSFACIQMKRLDRAAAEAERGLDRHPRDARLLGRLAALHVLGRNRPRAKEVCEEWLRIDPEAAEPYRLLGRVAREQGRPDEARRFGEAALQRAPRDATVCHELSKTLAALPGPSNARRALELARQAAELNPREADHWHQLGVLLRAAGRSQEAATALARALDTSAASTASGSVLVQIAGEEGRPDSARFFAGLVTALEQRNREETALWRAVYQNPGSAMAHEQLARHLRERGDLRRARYQLQDRVALRPGDRMARRELAVIERLLALRAP